MPYVFGNLEATPGSWPAIPDTVEERALSDAMLDYWTSFARTGVPEADNGPDWLPFAKSQAYIEFGDRPELKTDLLPGIYELHEEIVNRRRNAGDQPWDWRAGSIAPPLPSAQ